MSKIYVLRGAEKPKHQLGLRLDNSFWPENTTGVCVCVYRALGLTLHPVGMHI